MSHPTPEDRPDNVGPTAAEARKENPLAWYTTIAGVIVVMLFGGLMITNAYLKRRHYEIVNSRPPLLNKLKDFQAINRDSSEISLSDLRGKVYIVGWQFTDCPSGCIGMAAEMESLALKHANNEDFHVVSVAIDPENETPEKLNAWVQDHGLDAPNWWFLTGDKEKIHKYMVQGFKMLGVSENTDPADIAAYGKWRHDQRIALVDRTGHLRGLYDVMSTLPSPINIDGEEVTIGELAQMKLEKDVEFLLETETTHPTE